MKLSVFTVMLPDFTPEETLKVLARTGYDGVEWRVTHNDPQRAGEEPSFWGNNHSTLSPDLATEELRRLKEAQEDQGLAVPNLGCYLACGDLASTEQGMKVAKELGAPSIRVGVPYYDRMAAYGDLLAEARRYLDGVQELSEQYGVKGLVEIHMGNISASASLARRLVEGFHPERIGVIHDAGNMVHEGFENYRLGLEVLGDYLSHVHVKNASWLRADATPQPPRTSSWNAHWAPLREGAADLGQLFADLRHIGYNGWLSIEDFSLPHPNEASLRDQAEYLRSLWG
ncbi:sugar phosphate isomerase/epimerase family protein [Gorillibacterium timonense]|uniref:sugar phosphate isomerase/epimerase family protein n=1 Tax=Gorillibacterium timonense TaxID=1689269 RepID=UPI00071DB370|nr:sugar phosphate isomerase/epimerase [Gorillibacterium timonense]